MRKMILSLALAASVSWAGLAPGLADAASLPKIQTTPLGWYHGWKVRPRNVYFGGGAGFSAPRIDSLRYTHYNGHSAGGYGRWLLDSCEPDCAEGGHFVTAHVKFYGLFYHKGPGLNFGYARVSWHHRGYHTALIYINGKGQWVYTGTPNYW
jgi:hypothetical protein